MGNCLAPVVADIVMVEVQKIALGRLSFCIPIFKRYVDDICTSIPDDKVEETITVFNSVHPRLKFTIEVESQENTLPFLDVLLIRHGNEIKYNWYRKPTFSGRVLNFNSKHTITQKINIINNLKNRALKLSSPEFHRDNLNQIKAILQKNDYPTKIIEKIIYRESREQIQEDNMIENKKFYALTYVEGLSEQIRRNILSLGVDVAFRSENTNRKLFTKIKSTTPKELLSNVIYKICCKDCQSTYVGQTGRYLKDRISEHERDSLNILNPLKKKKDNNTALAEHVSNTLHSFDFNIDSIKILGHQKILKKRLLHEMISIKQDEKSINRRTDIDSLNTAYYYLINKMKRKIT
ncbi:uncharacterized protein LOC123313564 [Coccinella septempunctata]|uniref:uncharacterized protein LOC123313564 n=1 Tax=Coccinella septempunctata TaxID=41139 RepID=UPI001D06A515|nr:uncharacterized protein LOC123313564 [Coccinella septempunctata]